jgi:hypothetical protein
VNLNLNDDIITVYDIWLALEAVNAMCEHVGSLCVIEYKVQWCSLTIPMFAG